MDFSVRSGNLEIKIEEDTYKDKIYIIGSLSQKETIKSTADYYMNTGRYRVRYVKEEAERSFKDLVKDCFLNILWADRIYVIPKPDGTLGDGVTYEVTFAELIGKRVEIFMTKSKIESMWRKE